MKSLSISIVIGAFSPIINAALAPAATGLSYVVPPPSSNGGKAWVDAFARAEKLVVEMTLSEKVSMVTGQAGPCAGNSGNITRLGIPKMCFQDGPAGVRPALGHTQFPSSLTTAATWDVELMYNRSYAMGKEFYDMTGRAGQRTSINK